MNHDRPFVVPRSRMHIRIGTPVLEVPLLQVHDKMADINKFTVLLTSLQRVAYSLGLWLMAD